MLTTRRFLPLMLTQFLGAFNDNLFKNSLVILITYVMAARYALEASVLVPLAGAILILPFFIFSATAGQLADKYDKALLSRWIKFAEIILMLAAALGFYLDNLYFLLTVLFLMGTQSAFFGPIKYGILPDHLDEHELLGGNALIETTTFLAILTGAILGGLLILNRDYGILAISASVVAVAILGWITSLFIPTTTPAVPNLKVGYNIIRATWKIIDNARKDRIVFLCALGTSWFWMLGANFLAAFPPLTKDLIGANEEVVTLFLLSFSLGITIGSLLCNRLLQGEVNAAYVPIGALGLSIFMADAYFISATFTANPTELLGIVGFFAMPGSWHLLFSLVMVAVFGGIFIVPLYAILQQQSPPEHRARNIAASNVLNALFVVLGGVASAVLMHYGVSIPQLFLLMAILNIGVIIVTDRLLPGILVRTVLTWILWLLYRVEVHGLENLKRAGDKVLIIPNHLSFLDAILIAAYMRKPPTFAIDTFIAQKPWISLFLRLTHANTQKVDPTNPLALRTLVACLRRGEQVVIFPEGRITVTGGLMKIYEGPALVAERAGVNLLPVRLDGPQYTPFGRLQGKVRQRWFPKMTMHFLPARTLTIPDQIRGRKRRQYAGNRLYDIMSAAALESSDARYTLFQTLINASNLHGPKHIILEDITHKPLSYRQLITASLILGKALIRDSQTGDRVGLLLPNVLGMIVSFMGLQAYGRVPAMLNYSTGASSVVLACQIATLKIVYSSRKFVEAAKLTELVQAIEAIGVTVRYLEDVKEQLTTYDKLFGLLAGRWSILSKLVYHYSCPNKDPQAPAVVLFTSGTEGAPKGVVLSHYNLQSNRNQVAARVDFNPTDLVFNALPLFHSFGLSTATLLPLMAGLKVFLYPSPLHYRAIPELIYSTNATILFGTDTFLSGYARYAHPYDFYKLRLVFSGAERLKPTTRQLYSERFGVRVFEGYGATETAPVLAVNTPLQNRPGTVGRLMPDVEWRLEPVPGIAEGGSLLVKGPNIMLGYLKLDNPGVLQPLADGWYDTGDIVQIDADGYVAIKGRLKRFAKIGGEMVSLTAVETLVNQLWPGYGHAVVALPDKKKGERLILVTNYQLANREDLSNFARSEGFMEIGIPKIILNVAELPVLGAGKLDYMKITTLAAAELANGSK
ncbi:2-acyl-glycerophospho-ethanolamine acyltransferase [Achromatium sp. WMS2]|nr:2-acyl-glycerophospho-ethanolamine acyltransferase [Achromatium sp. WMS2]